MSYAAAHKARVQLLYRRLLKEQLNWKAQRDVWQQNALYTRMLFEEKKALKDTGDIEAALNGGQRWLETRKHPDPYTSQSSTHTAHAADGARRNHKGTGGREEEMRRGQHSATATDVPFRVSLRWPRLFCRCSSDAVGWLLLPTQRRSSSLRQRTLRTLHPA